MGRPPKPWYWNPNTPITARMLMAHTSSIVDSDAFFDIQYSSGDSPISLREVVEEYLTPGGECHSEDNFELSKPGASSEYSNMGTLRSSLPKP